jgi:hypothetical protein
MPPEGVLMNCDFGTGTNIATLSPGSSWKKVIANYDHIYIWVVSGRAASLETPPGTNNSVYWLVLSKGPWPLVQNAGTRVLELGLEAWEVE